jgi:hypothetical protein
LTNKIQIHQQIEFLFQKKRLQHVAVLYCLRSKEPKDYKTHHVSIISTFATKAIEANQEGVKSELFGIHKEVGKQHSPTIT